MVNVENLVFFCLMKLIILLFWKRNMYVEFRIYCLLRLLKLYYSDDLLRIEIFILLILTI